MPKVTQIITMELKQSHKKSMSLDLLKGLNQKRISPISKESQSPSGIVEYKILAYRGAEGLRLKFMPQVLIYLKCVTIIREVQKWKKKQ